MRRYFIDYYASMTRIGRASFLIGLGMFAGCGSDDGSTVTLETAATDVSEKLFVDDDPIVVPDGTPEELFAFMEATEIEILGKPDDADESDAAGSDSGSSETENAATSDEQEQSEEDQARVLLRVMNARVTACDKILERSASDTARTRALRIRLDALRTLAALDPENRTTAFNEFADKLAAGNDPLIRRIALATKFQFKANQYISTDGQSADDLLELLATLLKEKDAGPEILGAARDAGSWIFQSGDVETATKAYRMVGQAFRANEDKVLADEAGYLLTQAINLELSERVRRVADEEPGAIDDLMAKLADLLKHENEDPTVLEFSMQTAQFLEFSGNSDSARRAYKLIRQRFKDDEERAGWVAKSVDLAERRLDLIGSALPIEGVTLTGGSFDWNSYRGKPVLVCFWTSWLEATWLTELENIRKAISENAPNVQVVLINLDDDRNMVERFLKEHPTAWPVLVSPDPGVAGFENENAKRCGVEMVPFSILVDAESTVVDIHLMGPRLVETLKALN